MPATSDLHDSLQDLSELLGRGLVLTDERLRVVGYSIHESESARARLSSVLAHSDAWSVPARTSGVRVQDLPGHGSLQLVPLDDNGQRVGFLLVPLAPELSETAHDVLDRHAPMLAVLLALRSRRAGRDSARMTRLLGDLSGADEPARRTAAESLRREGMLGASRNYSAVALGCSVREDVADPAAAVGLAVESVLDFVNRTSTASLVGAVLDDGIGMLVFPRPVVAERLERILARPSLAAVRAGIGPLVADLAAVGESYARARDAWRVNEATRPGSRVSVWEDVGVDRLLVRLPLADLGREDLPAEVQRVVAADLGRELVATLAAYLDHSGEITATAQALHIHRSTLYYRLNRIRELARVDASEPAVRQELTIGLRIARLAGLV